MSYRGVAVSGKQGAGKTALIKAIQAELHRAGAKTQVVSFAEPVKSLSKAVLVALGLIPHDTPEADWKYTYRAVPQTVGSHLRGYDQDIWVNLTMSCIAKLDPAVIVLNDDCRFPNEADGLRKAGIFVARLEVERSVRLQRLGNLNHENHTSETALDLYEDFDLVLHQDVNAATPAVYAREILKFVGLPMRADSVQSHFAGCCGAEPTQAHQDWCPTLNGALLP